jgi:hypothetical protein
MCKPVYVQQVKGVYCATVIKCHHAIREYTRLDATLLVVKHSLIARLLIMFFKITPRWSTHPGQARLTRVNSFDAILTHAGSLAIDDRFMTMSQQLREPLFYQIDSPDLIPETREGGKESLPTWLCWVPRRRCDGYRCCLRSNVRQTEAVTGGTPFSKFKRFASSYILIEALTVACSCAARPKDALKRS